jgi:hypothetical protein
VIPPPLPTRPPPFALEDEFRGPLGGADVRFIIFSSFLSEVWYVFLEDFVGYCKAQGAKLAKKVRRLLVVEKYLADTKLFLCFFFERVLDVSLKKPKN